MSAKFVREINVWIDEINEIDEEMKQRRSGQTWSDSVTPLRKTCVISSDEIANEQMNEQFLKVEENIKNKVKESASVKSSEKMKEYYSKWDNFAEKEVKNESEKQKTAQKQPQKTNDAKNNSNSNNNNNNNNIELQNLEKVSLAIAEKEKGNGWFKQGEWGKAGQCYGRGMALDPTNSILPLNRAMCYLKLSDWREAIEDCNRALVLDQCKDVQVKALYRKATAQFNLRLFNDAKISLQKLLQISPANKDAQKLMENVQNEEKIAKETKGNANNNVNINNNNNNNNNNIININKNENIKKVENEPIKSPEKLITETNNKIIIEEKPIEKKETKETTPIIPPPNNSPKKTIMEPPKALNLVQLQLPAHPPSTGFEFEKVWHSIKHDPLLIYHFLLMIEAQSYPKIFSSSMTSLIFTAILNSLSTSFIGDAKYQLVFDILFNISKVGRFKMLSKFLSSAEKESLRNIINLLRENNIANSESLLALYSL